MSRASIETLRSNLRALIGAVLTLVPQAARCRPWTGVSRFPGGQASFDIEQRPDVGNLVTGLVGRVDHLPAYRALHETIAAEPDLVQTVFVDASGNPIPSAVLPGFWLLNNLVTPFLGRYLRLAQGEALDEHAFDAVFESLSNELAGAHPPVRFVTPLLNVAIGAEVIPLTACARLRRVSDAEVEEWVNLGGPTSDRIAEIDEILSIGCAVEIVLPDDKDALDGGYRQTDTVVSALRLVTAHDIHVLFTQMRFDRLLRQGGQFHRRYAIRIAKDLVQLDDRAVADVASVCKALVHGGRAGRLKVAMRRWNQASERVEIEDRLVDYWIALESILLPNMNQELKYRAALRAAALIGESPQERNSIYTDLRRSYDLRSKCVHGDPVEPGELQGVLLKTRDYLRRVILKLLHSAKPLNLEEAEEWLLTGLYPT